MEFDTETQDKILCIYIFYPQLVVAILAVAESVPGRKRPRGGTERPTGRPGPRCWTVYDTVYNTVYENQCNNHYQQSCTITSYRPECVTEVDDCFEAEFKPDYKRQCSIEYVTDCNTPDSYVCNDTFGASAICACPEKYKVRTPKRICKQVPVQTPRKTQKQNCNSLPREICKNVPERNCQSMPRQSCQNVPKRIAAQVGRQVCSG